MEDSVVNQSALGSNSDSLFEQIKMLIDGVECWDARELMPVVGYLSWRQFEGAIDKAMIACKTNQIPVENHFLPAPAKNSGDKGRPGANYLLTRTACYYVFQNADPRKPEIAAAQAYFIAQTRKQERQDRLALDMRRVLLHDRVLSSTESLSRTATMLHNVSDPEKMNQAGSRGMYNLDIDLVEEMKGIEPGRLLDFIDSAELAAHYFRVTQTEVALENDAVDGYTYDQEGAEALSESVGVLVRSTMRESGKTLPEDLPRAEDIEPIKRSIIDYQNKQKSLDVRPTKSPKTKQAPKQIDLFDQE